MLLDFLPRLELNRARQRESELRTMARAFLGAETPTPEQIADIEQLDAGFHAADVVLPELPVVFGTLARHERILARALRATFGAIALATARLCAAFDVAGIHYAFRSTSERDCALAITHQA